ncbi:T9SS type A sorting domain-containing protein [uncultured Algibacter sp.]|uniref:T9SS type A sorting domain-containing protein n=1 Tax=uncultured Algibacter sp. TaxID=298659 RepID=UPI00321624D4
MKKIKQKHLVITFLLAMFTSSVFSQRLNRNEGRFFTDNISNKRVNVNNLTGAKNATDSSLLTKLIDETSRSGGGTIYLMPHKGKSTFYFNNVIFKSNIHLKIDPRVTIINLPVSRNTTVFNIGDSGPVENIAITSLKENSTKKSDAFKVELQGKFDTAVSLIALRNVKNFKVSSINIKDNYTKFNNIVMNLPKSRIKTQIATKGIVQNIYTVNNHVGYGAIQTQSAKTVLFKNINCTGGTALRIETGSSVISVNNIQTVDDLVGKGIRSFNGLCAVDLSPHRVNQGQVDITNVSSSGSTYAVIISGGFKDRREKGSIDNLGTFSDKSYVQISKVTGGNTAQVKGKDFPFYSCVVAAELKKNAKNNPDNESTNATSIAVVRDSADPSNGCKSTGNKARGCYKPTVILPRDSNISGSFARSGRSKKTVYDGDKTRGCGRSRKIATEIDFNDENEESVDAFAIYPNPASDILNVRGAKSKIVIYGVTGQVVMESKPTQNSVITQLDISKLDRGVYFISNGIQTKKIIHN